MGRAKFFKKIAFFMHLRVIIITGTPGTGKSSLARALVSRLGWAKIDVGVLIRQAGLRESWDSVRKCWIIDERALVRNLTAAIKAARARGQAGLIIASHLAHALSPRLVDLCIVTRCELGVLAKRLRARRWPDRKIEENLQAEIFEVCADEARRAGHNVLELDTSAGIKAALKALYRERAFKRLLVRARLLLAL